MTTQQEQERISRDYAASMYNDVHCRAMLAGMIAQAIKANPESLRILEAAAEKHGRNWNQALAKMAVEDADALIRELIETHPVRNVS